MELLDKDGQPVKKNNRIIENNGIVIGLILIAVGAVWVMSNMGIINYSIRRIFISWQMLLIVLGVVELAKKHITSGLVLALTGGFFIIPRVAHLFPDGYMIANRFTANYWPFLLIIVGVVIIATIITRKNSPTEQGFSANFSRDRDNEYSNINGTVHYDFMFSGTEQVFLEPVFHGGDINVLFGGVTLDLRRTSLPEGVTTLKVDALFGGTTIIAPSEWDIEIRQKSIFGGFKDNRMVVNSEKSAKLVVVADCLFGGGEIK
ncbi:MAG: DUF5668 domain-containing protein [Bacteroidales bacterium]|nr:DUF5668 domain-containing protein [Bacteroidales bacterium]MDD4670296.1 DUF5668 domain-containing protein [Bacteroidales bacterium]